LKKLRALYKRFEMTPPKEGVSHVGEGCSYDNWAAEVRKV
jgi:hypothetical protein